jgi:hypothetical protein
MKTDPDAPCNELIARDAQESTAGLTAEEVAVPTELGGGVATAKVVPNPEEGLSEVELPGTQVELEQRAAIEAAAGGLSAEEQALRDQWAANGNRVASCREYVYEKYYDYARFEDGVVARHDDYPYLVDQAFTPPGGIAERGVLKMKEGLDMTVQAPEQGFVVPVGPDNDCYWSWTNLRLDNPFYAMPDQLAREVQEDLNLRDRRCYRQDVSEEPPSPGTRNDWAWHGQRMAAAQEKGYAPVELDEMYVNVRKFQGALVEYRALAEGPRPAECRADPDADLPACLELRAQQESIEARLKDLFRLAVEAGCLDDRLSSSLCSWAPALFVERLRARFGRAMDEDFRRCLEFTGDDFTELQHKVFTYDTVNGPQTYPESCDPPPPEWTLPTCPEADFTVSASTVDTYLSLVKGPVAQAQAAADRDFVSRIHPSLRNPQTGAAELPADEWGANHMAGNDKFGVDYRTNLSWSIPGLTTGQGQSLPEQCAEGPEAAGSFSIGGWAFGSSRQVPLDASFQAGLEEILEFRFAVLGMTMWSPVTVQDFIENSGFAVSTDIVPPCLPEPGRQESDEERDRRCPPLEVQISVAGIPLVVSAAVSGSLSLQGVYEIDAEHVPTPPEAQRCWGLRTGFAPGLDLDVYASVALGMKIAKVGISCGVTLVQLSLPITFTLTEAIGKNAADQDSLDLTTSLGVALRTTLLRGYLAVFVELDLGLFSASYSYKIFKWGGIELPDVPLWEAWGYTVSLSQLVDVIERQ